MAEHPIEGLMKTAMNSIKDMIDVNTIIGKPIQAGENIIVIPISKVSFGFAAGGSEFKGETIDEYTRKDKEEAIQYRLPFGGGSGAGVNITAVAFLVVQDGNVKLMSIEHPNCMDKLLEYIPDLAEKADSILEKMCNKEKKENCKNRKESSSDDEKCSIKITQNYVDEYVNQYDEKESDKKSYEKKKEEVTKAFAKKEDAEVKQEEEVLEEDDEADIKVEFYNQIIPPQSDGESFEDD